jgi:hypothetical protein
MRAHHQLTLILNNRRLRTNGLVNIHATSRNNINSEKNSDHAVCVSFSNAKNATQY